MNQCLPKPKFKAKAVQMNLQYFKTG